MTPESLPGRDVHPDSPEHNGLARNMGNMDNMDGASPTRATAPSGDSHASHAAGTHGTGEMAGMEMSGMEQNAPWAHFFAAIILGVWLITSPFTLDYNSVGLGWSDVISGALIIVLATITLVRGSAWSVWANSLVGVWLLFAPLVFWAPTGAGFTNDTLAGTLMITFVLLMPGMPGMKMLPGPDAPPGWSYNPSTWPQRAPIIVLALIGFFLSRYMAAYQLGYIDSIWDPFFSPGTQAVLDSEVSRSFPVSDAGLGGVAYMVEALMGFMGDKRRWRTMPWMVTFFGILVVPLGIASITLIILQPLAVGEWCTPCLIAGVAMLVMIALTLDEVVAMAVFLARAKKEGQNLWRVFWLGGTLEKAAAVTDPSSPPAVPVVPVRPDVIRLDAMVWGVTLPWNLLASVALGLWLMASPSVLGFGGAAAHSNHLIGALVVTMAMMALGEVGRPIRFVNVLFGAWFIISPWLLDGATTASTVSDIIVGAALILLSLRRGPVREKYGEWNRYIV
jgi:hypothetical protein